MERFSPRDKEIIINSLKNRINVSILSKRLRQSENSINKWIVHHIYKYFSSIDNEFQTIMKLEIANMKLEISKLYMEISDLKSENNIQKQLSEYLDIHFGKKYLKPSNQSIYKNKSYKPDKLYIFGKFVIHVGCDNNQNFHKSNDFFCEEKRILNIYINHPERKYIIIRWNPDEYKHPSNKTKKNNQQRLELLVKMMKNIVKHVTCKEFNIPILIIYMFYNKDNPFIIKNIKHKFIY